MTHKSDFYIFKEINSLVPGLVKGLPMNDAVRMIIKEIKRLRKLAKLK